MADTPPYDRRVQRLGARLLRITAVLGALQVLAWSPWLSPATPVSTGEFASFARVAPLALPPSTDSVDGSVTSAIDRALAARVEALQRRDRPGWLASTTPAARGRQGELFDSLVALPLADLTVVRSGPVRAGPAGSRVDVVLSYRLAGWDARPVAATRTQVFVVRQGRALLAADAPAAGSGSAEIWDGGPVVAVRSGPALVLGHPRDRRTVQTVAAAAAQAVPRVTSVWGPQWQRRVVVLVPASQGELRSLLGESGVTSQIAAYATSRAPGVGERVVVNPATFPLLGSVGRRVVLTHEVTHLAARSSTGPGMPLWLVEGFADHVGYTGLSLPYRVSAQELRHEVRRGRLPAALPSDADFAGDNPRLAAVYEQAWLAVRLLVEQHGRSAVLRFYRAVGAGEQIEPALRRILSTDLRSFTAAWQRDLRTRLA